MQQAHLNGDLTSKFYALGIEGTPFFRYADTFKDSLERTAELGVEVSRFFAIPKLNNDQSYIDFYIPFAPKSANQQYEVIPYSQMSDDERDKVKRDIRDLKQKFLKVANSIKSRGLKGDEALFATLLLGDKEDSFPSLLYPSNDYVFLVDNQVVLTFWGFVQYERKERRARLRDKNVNNASLNNESSNLDKVKVAPALGAATGVAAAGAAASANAKPLDDAKFEERIVREETIKRTVIEEEQKKVAAGFFTCERHKGCLRWLLALLLLLLLLALLWWLLTRFLGNPFSLPTLGLDNGVKQEMPLDNKDKVKEEPLVEDKALVDNINDPNLNGVNGDTINGAKVNDNTPNITNNGLNADGSTATPNASTTTPNVDGDVNSPNNKNIDPVDMPNVSQDDKGAKQDLNNNVNNQDLLKDANKSEDAKSPNLDPIDLENQKSEPNKVQKPSNNLDLDKLKNNDISVIDGKWGTRSGIMDASTGKPLNMEYNFKDGKGDITVTRLDGSKCTTKAISSIANGQLQISPQGKAICPDNATYSIPNVKCNVNAQDKAKCNGSYQGKEDFPMQMFSK